VEFLRGRKRQVGIAISVVASLALIVGGAYFRSYRVWFLVGWAIALVAGKVLNELGWREEKKEHISRRATA